MLYRTNHPDVRLLDIPIAWDVWILVPSRRLEDRIRELCAKAVSAPDSADFNEVMQQLRESLREHANRLRQLAARKLQPRRNASS